MIISISDFSPGGQQAWPAQVRAQAHQVQYGLDQRRGGGGEIVHHGDHYHVQQQQQRPQYRPQEPYQARGAWQNYQQNEIQDFYRQQRGAGGGHLLKDF